MSCWPEGPGLAHTAKKDTQTKAGARTAAKSSTWQGPRLLQEARSSLEAAPHGASDARYHRALCGWTLSQKLSFSHTREVSCQLFPFRHRPASRGGILATVPSSFRQGFLMAASDSVHQPGGHLAAMGRATPGGEATLGITLQVLPLGRQVSLRYPTPAIGDLYHLPASLSGTCGDLPLLTFSVLSHTSPVVGETLSRDHQKETPHSFPALDNP